ncbi:MAG: hypothetical protein MUO23_11400 [Anaerolineales bacterium]|nr:hypothetical protein [Anaerolineales bacterium]
MLGAQGRDNGEILHLLADAAMAPIEKVIQAVRHLIVLHGMQHAGFLLLRARPRRRR